MFKLVENPSFVVHSSGERALALFPSRPFWVAGGRSLLEAVQELNGLKGLDSLNPQKKQLAQLLVDAQVLRCDEDHVLSHTDIEPHAQLHDVESILIISLTEGCNLACPHCYADAHHRNKNEMTTVQVFNVLHQVTKLPWGPNESSIGLIGGEPLIRRDILEITDRINELGYEIVLSTNGLLLSDKHISRFRNYRIKVSISLDGPSASVHEDIRGLGTFDRTVKAIQRLVSAGIPVGVNTFVHEGNFEHLADIFVLAVKLGVQSLNINTLMYVGRGLNGEIKPVPRPKLYRRIFEIVKDEPAFLNLIHKSNFANKVVAVRGGLKSRYCGIGTNRALYVRSDGTLYPCGDTCIPDFQLADLNSDDLSEVWNSSQKLKELRRLDIDQMNSTCAVCDVRYYCAGDCRGEHYQKTGQFLSPHFKCQEIRESILEIMWMLSEKPDFLLDRTDEVVEKARIISSEE